MNVLPHAFEMWPVLSIDNISVIERHDPSAPSDPVAIAPADGSRFFEVLIALGSLTMGDFLQPVRGRNLLNGLASETSPCSIRVTG